MSDYRWRDIGDGQPVRVQVCSMCGVAPSNVDDCGEFGNPECPYFGIGLEAYEAKFANKVPTHEQEKHSDRH